MVHRARMFNQITRRFSSSTSRNAIVAGVGMTKFTKPGSSKIDYPEMVANAARDALKDAGIDYNKHVQLAVCGFVFSESTSGNRSMYELGLSGIPIINVNNNCATGSTALHLANKLVSSGAYDCILAVGFEKMQKGSIQWGVAKDTESPMSKFFDRIKSLPDAPPYDAVTSAKNPYMFATVAREHMRLHGSNESDFAKIAEKNHIHSVDNPNSQFRVKYSLDEILNSPMQTAPMTRLQCSPTSDGAAAAVIVSRAFFEKHLKKEKKNDAVELLACEMVSDTKESFHGSAADAVGQHISSLAAKRAYAKANVTAQDIDVIELHDCFSVNELITYEALQLCGMGKGHTLVREGKTNKDSKWYVNPSGGLISKGHPLGASGLAQICELSWHLRNMAGQRQAKKIPNFALAHNLGMGGVAVVSILKRAE